MIEKDTVRLLRECDAGVNMGISSIDEVSKDITKRLINLEEKLTVDIRKFLFI